MARLRTIILLLACVLAPAGDIDAAETVKLVHSRSAYADAQGAALNRPEGVACGPGSTVVVADTRNGRLVRYALSAEALTEGKPIKVPQLQYPVRIHVGPNGDILVLDGKLRSVLRLNADGAFLATVEPKGVPNGNVVPKSFALDREGGIYFLDIFFQRVVVTDPSGNYRREIPFPEQYGFFSDLTVDAQGTVLLLDSVAGSIYAADKNASAFSSLAKNLREYASFPVQVTTDGKGTMYIVDQNGAGVIMLGKDGSYLGRQLTMGWKEGLLYYPSRMCICPGEVAVIADRENNRVQVFKVLR